MTGPLHPTGEPGAGIGQLLSPRGLPWFGPMRWVLAVVVAAWVVLPGALAADTNAPAAARDSAALARRIAERNIFDPDRQPRSRGDSRPAPKPRPVIAADAAEFGLVGVMSYARGTFAFFDGNDPEYRKTLAQAATIAGHTLGVITPQSVTLVGSNGPPVQLRVGQRMRRDSDGNWQPVTSAAGEPFARSATSGSTTGGGSAGSSGSATGAATTPAEDPPGSDEILKRLLKKREQEMK